MARRSLVNYNGVGQGGQDLNPSLPGKILDLPIIRPLLVNPAIRDLIADLHAATP
jgi:hypothetical protein